MRPVTQEDLDAVLAVIAVVGTTSASVVARYSGIPNELVAAALDELHRTGQLDGDRPAGDGLASVNPMTVASIHALVAEDRLRNGPVDIEAARWHARSAQGFVPTDRLSELADRAADLANAVGERRAAERLFHLADELDTARRPEALLHRLTGLADALDGLGDVIEAKSVRARAYEIADLSGLVEERARIAIDHAFPSDWFEGDHRSSALLIRADVPELDPATKAALTATRGLVMMRVPIGVSDSEQVA